ncbi:MAG: lysophospholipid acyltransferase family protein [bacterium]|nr:lysophospholipid acyltransferase family protein [bacterium]
MAIHKSYQLGHSLSRVHNWGKIKYPSVSRFFYNLFWIPLKAVFGYFLQIEVESKENLSNIEGPVIIASSHGSWTDSFIIGICFPFNAKISPIRYAVLWKYYYFPPFTLLLWLFGSFPVRKGVGLDNALRVPLKIIKDKGCVGIFPTGKRAKKWNQDQSPKPRRGAAYLALKTNARVLPIKLEGNVGMSFLGFLNKKYKVKVKIGRAMYLPFNNYKNETQLTQAADFVMDRIMKL